MSDDIPQGDPLPARNARPAPWSQYAIGLRQYEIWLAKLHQDGDAETLSRIEGEYRRGLRELRELIDRAEASLEGGGW